MEAGMTRRTGIAIGLAVVSVLGAAQVALSLGGAAGPTPRGGFERPIDHTAYAYTREDATTDSDQFVAIGLPGIALCNVAGLTTDVSLELTGGPAEIRVVAFPSGPRPHVLGPGAVTVTPGPDGYTGTYTFGSQLKKGNPGIEVQWRALSGVPVTLDSASLRALYHRTKGKDLCL